MISLWSSRPCNSTLKLLNNRPSLSPFVYTPVYNDPATSSILSAYSPYTSRSILGYFCWHPYHSSLFAPTPLPSFLISYSTPATHCCSALPIDCCTSPAVHCIWFPSSCIRLHCDRKVSLKLPPPAFLEDALLWMAGQLGQAWSSLPKKDRYEWAGWRRS